jgi:hypothetical protein
MLRSVGTTALPRAGTTQSWALQLSGGTERRGELANGSPSPFFINWAVRRKGGVRGTLYD